MYFCFSLKDINKHYTMKISTLFKTILLIVALGAIFTPVSAQRVVLNEDSETTLSVVSQDVTHLEMKNIISGFDYKTMSTEGGLFTEFYSHANSFSGKTGEPRIPVLRKLIEVPLGAELVIEGITYSKRTINLGDEGIIYPLFPVQLPVPKNGDNPPPFQFNEQAYNLDHFYGNELVQVEDKGLLRAQRLALVTISPYQYNPVTNTLVIFDNVQFDVVFKGGNIAATQELKAKTWSPYFGSHYDQAINARSFNTKDPLSSYPVTYVIISDPMFQDQLVPFVEWKTKKGFKVIEGYVGDPEVGSTTTSIKAFIKDLYDNPAAGFTPPSFVLFVGDTQQVPVFNGTAGSHVTDLYYCEYTGDDFAEIYYGRFSAQTTAQLQPQIDKTLMVEQYTMPDPTYLNEVVMVAGMDGTHGYNWGNGQITYGVENYFNEDHGVSSYTYLYPNSGSNAALIRQEISEGVAYANYTAHCSQSGWADPSFSVSDIPSLQNEGMYYLSVGNCCLSNAFDSNECFGEALLRAEGKGAVAHIGGTNSTYWDEDYYWGVGVGTINQIPPSYDESTLGAYDCLFHENGEEFSDWCAATGQMIFAGNRAVSEGSPSSSTYYWEIYSVMGDPSLAMYISEGSIIDVTYDALMPLGSTEFTVSTEPYAYVAISREGELFGSALADATGQAVVVMDPPISVPGQADLVVTKQFGQPYMGEVLVASPEGPYVLMSSYLIDDSEGNNNGLADYSETINLNIELNNVGNSEATGVTATLTSASGDITITSGSHTWGDIAVHGTSMETAAFTFDVNTLVEDGEIAEMNLQIKDSNDEIWNSKINVALHAPVLNIGNISINDETGGDGNGRLDAGETADIIVGVNNIGSADIASIAVMLSSSSTGVTINTAEGTIDAITAGGNDEVIFSISVNNDVTVGTVIEMDLTASAMGYNAEKAFMPKVGLIMEDFETGDFSSFNWSMGDFPWTVIDGGSIVGEYCAKSAEISDSQTTDLTLTIDVLAADTIKFYAKVSSEANYDWMRFYIDGVKKGEWSGTVDWTEVKYPISVGVHELKWTYEKDVSVSNDSDCGWIDYIIFPAISDYVGVNDFMSIGEDNISVYPNPFNNTTRISYTLDKDSDVSIMVYNAVGDVVEIIENASNRRAGTYTHEFNADGLDNGIYFCVFASEGKMITKKLVVVE